MNLSRMTGGASYIGEEMTMAMVAGRGRRHRRHLARRRTRPDLPLLQVVIYVVSVVVSGASACASGRPRFLPVLLALRHGRQR